MKTGRYTHGCGSYKDNEGNTVRGIEQKIINDGVLGSTTQATIESGASVAQNNEIFKYSS